METASSGKTVELIISSKHSHSSTALESKDRADQFCIKTSQIKERYEPWNEI